MDNLLRLDLNLLRTLDVLLAEHSVTRAAQRLHLSQPTVSVQLAKLREALDDPLLLPDSRGMKPTARADAIRQPLRAALHALESALVDGAEFDPANDDATWRISIFDYGEATVIQPLLASLREQAPNTRLALFQTQPNRVLARLERGEIDLAFQARDEAPQNLRSRKLFDEHYCLVGRCGHPALQHPLSLEEFCKLEHVVVSPNGGGFIGNTDKALEQLGYKRNVVLSVPHFLFMKQVVKNTNMVALMPSRLINPQTMESLKPPLEVDGFEMMMLWHERSHRDPRHQWLRRLIVDSL